MMYNTLNELPKFLGALYGGLVIGILYDLFRLLRLPFHKHRLVTGVIDALFYASAGVIAALTLLYVNSGAPRVYLFAGLALGAFVYIRFVGRLFNSLLTSISRAFRKKAPVSKS
jgi:spore cortex biosynthesis protein YabQ